MAVFILETDYSSKIILKPCHFHIERNYLPDANYPTENLSEMENRERNKILLVSYVDRLLFK